MRYGTVYSSCVKLLVLKVFINMVFIIKTIHSNYYSKKYQFCSIKQHNEEANDTCSQTQSFYKWPCTLLC